MSLDTTAQLARLARLRSEAWQTVAALADDPAQASAWLHTGRAAQSWRAALAPFAGQTPAADAALAALDRHAAGEHPGVEHADAERTTGAAGPAVAVPDPATPASTTGAPPPRRPVADTRTAAAAAATLAEQCRAEALAWQSGDPATAARLRADQLTALHTRAEAPLAALSHDLAACDVPPWPDVATVLLTWLATESGRDPRTP